MVNDYTRRIHRTMSGSARQEKIDEVNKLIDQVAESREFGTPLPLKGVGGPGPGEDGKKQKWQKRRIPPSHWRVPSREDTVGGASSEIGKLVSPAPEGRSNETSAGFSGGTGAVNLLAFLVGRSAILRDELGASSEQGPSAAAVKEASEGYAGGTPPVVFEGENIFLRSGIGQDGKAIFRQLSPEGLDAPIDLGSGDIPQQSSIEGISPHPRRERE